MKKLLIWGTGDQGTVTLDCALSMNRYNQIDFIKIKEKESRYIPHHILYEEDEFDNIIDLYDEVIVATGNNYLREDKILTLINRKTPIATIIHPTAVISPFAKVSQGCTILANAVINTNATVGIGCIINTGSIVEHDCVVGDFTNICPHASMAGHTRIGKKSFMGIGSTIIDDIEIGNEVIIGAGAVVIEDIPHSVTVVGIPAKNIK